jgi:hypothetical protein
MAEKDKADLSQDKKLIKKAFKMHDAQEHKSGKGTSLASLKKGGPTSADMKKMGRNLARAMNQKSSGRGR